MEPPKIVTSESSECSQLSDMACFNCDCGMCNRLHTSFDAHNFREYVDNFCDGTEDEAEKKTALRKYGEELDKLFQTRRDEYIRGKREMTEAISFLARYCMEFVYGGRADVPGSYTQRLLYQIVDINDVISMGITCDPVQQCMQQLDEAGLVELPKYRIGDIVEALSSPKETVRRNDDETTSTRMRQSYHTCAVKHVNEIDPPELRECLLLLGNVAIEAGRVSKEFGRMIEGMIDQSLEYQWMNPRLRRAILDAIPSDHILPSGEKVSLLLTSGSNAFVNWLRYASTHNCSMRPRDNCHEMKAGISPSASQKKRKAQSHVRRVL